MFGIPPETSEPVTLVLALLAAIAAIGKYLKRRRERR